MASICLGLNELTGNTIISYIIGFIGLIFHTLYNFIPYSCCFNLIFDYAPVFMKSHLSSGHLLKILQNIVWSS